MFRRRPISNRTTTFLRHTRLAGEELEARMLLIATPLITEFMAVNGSTLQSMATSSFDDWIEIYNPGPESVDLNGWYLTDTKSELHTWQFPQSVVLLEDEFLVVIGSQGLQKGCHHRNDVIFRGVHVFGRVPEVPNCATLSE